MLKDKQAVSNLHKLDQHAGHNPVELSRWRALGFGVLAFVECGDPGVDGDAFRGGRGHVQKVLLLDTLRQALETACFGDKIRVILETLLDTPDFRSI